MVSSRVNDDADDAAVRTDGLCDDPGAKLIDSPSPSDNASGTELNVFVSGPIGHTNP